MSISILKKWDHAAVSSNSPKFPLDNLPLRVLFCICTLMMRVLAIIVDKYCIIPL